MPRLKLEQIREKLGLIRVTMESYVKHGTIPIKLKKAFCDAFIEKVYVFDDDDDGNGKNKKTRVKIIFDAFESEGLLGFDEAEIEISSKMETLGSPRKAIPRLWYGFSYCGNDGDSKTSNATVRWTVAATSANTGGYNYFLQSKKCKRISSGSPKRGIPIRVSLFFAAAAPDKT